MPLDNQIRREDIGYRLAKALEIKGQGTPTFQLDSSVVPVVMVEDLSRGNELDFATNRWARGRGSTDGGGIFGKLSFNNHADSGIIVKVYQVHIFHDDPTPAEIGMTIEAAGIGSSVQINNTKGFTDSRLFQGSSVSNARLPSVDIRKDDSGGLAGHMCRFHVPPSAVAPGIHVSLGGWILRPGARLHFESLVVGTKFHASVEWTETNQ